MEDQNGTELEKELVKEKEENLKSCANFRREQWLFGVSR